MTQQVSHRIIRWAVSSVVAFISGLLLVGLPQVLQAQIATGGIAGTVTDSTGAKVAGALVTLTNTATGIAVKMPTTSAGAYFFGGVGVGTYSLKAVKDGFKAFDASGIQIHVQETDNLDIQLQVGSTTEQVTVTTSAAVIQTEDATLGDTVPEVGVDELPLVARNWAALTNIGVGVTTLQGYPAGTTNSGFVVSNGTNFWQDDVRLDGLDDNVEMYGGGQTGSNASIAPPPDAVQEFKIQTGDMNAEIGRSTGVVINAVVKSGTNRVQGDLWEYVRNTDLDANDYFNKQQDVPRSVYHQNQFGGTVGGPVVFPKLYNGRNKTFFFFDYQKTIANSPAPAFSSVPTALEASSGFTNLSDLITYNNNSTTTPEQDALGRSFPLGTVFDPATTRNVAAGATDPISCLANTTTSAVSVRDPFYTGGGLCGVTNFTTRASDLNQIPKNRLDPNAVTLLGVVYPAANVAGAGITSNYFQDGRSTVHTYSYDARIDETLGAKDFVFGVFDYYHEQAVSSGSMPLVADGQNSSLDWSPHYMVAGGYTHIFSPSLVNEFHYGFLHTIDNTSAIEDEDYGLPAQYGIQGIPQGVGNGGLPAINIGSLTGLGAGGWNPTLRDAWSNELSDNVTKIYGSHTFKTGFQLIDITVPLSQSPATRGSFTYSGQYTNIPNLGSGLTGIADILVTPEASTVDGVPDVGGVTSYSGSKLEPMDDNRKYWGAYFQDNWKVTPKLTLNLGLRWDLFTPYAEIHGNQANFIEAGGGNGPGGTFYMTPNTCKTPLPTAFAAMLVTEGINVACTSNDTGETQHTNFAPRVGFAYRVLPRLVVRAGYGIAYGALGNIGAGGTLGQNYPFSFNVGQSAPNSVTPLALPNGQTATMENTFAAISLITPGNQIAGISLYGRQWNYQSPYTQTMNLTFQYQLTHSDAVQAAYVGTLGRHLDILGGANSPDVIEPPGANIYSYIPLADLQPNEELESTNGASAYNSLQAGYGHQATRGLWIDANYTYAKCFSDQSTQNSVLGIRAEWLPGYGIKGNYTLCDSDAKQVFHFTSTYDLPFGRGRQFLASVNKATDLMVGGWVIAGILVDQGGQPFTVSCPTATNAFFGCNADLVPGQNPYAGPHNVHQWLNPNAFATPPVATAGTTSFASLGRTAFQVRGPAYNNIDASMFKDFHINDQAKIQFRAETFNSLNHPEFSAPSNLNYTVPTNFSAIYGERSGPRIIQLALKLYY